jgi:cytochrome b6-f complex iron-sulfur subunit
MPEPDPSRRDFLTQALAAWAAVAAGGVAAGAGVSLWPREEPPATVRIPKSALAGGYLRESLRGLPIALMAAPGGPIALSLTCPHARCTVKWEEAEKKFLCPCHAGAFDASGKVLSGPPPAPLRRLDVRDAGDSWEVTG